MYIESKASFLFVFTFGETCPTPEPISAVLGTNVLWLQGCRFNSILKTLDDPLFPSRYITVFIYARLLVTTDFSCVNHKLNILKVNVTWFA